MSSRRIEEIDGEEYIIKEVVSKTSSIGRLLWTINQFIIAPFLIGTSGTIGVGFGIFVVVWGFNKTGTKLLPE